ncbi:gliding motility-associated ABC transporter substrate-binding protein GldG [Mesonia sp. K7]|uniref:gliding motility-associated ABC transporter substrate-binding protein GldG n=1 Tax=Mesonia sp. K7 TaxID=2218606 RepID=UPI000DAA1ED7|nr:gliding motility-associated ABC transporter substrate-binding protein GldG [Mesonia sp. K7]PZD78097.1 gliding motility-associated ABC transporter substrate-binding protein GldG [Mesonia sp. K7]
MKNKKQIIIFVIMIIAINLLATQFFFRTDLTENNRYTLSETSKNIVNQSENPVIVEVFLKGDFPSEFKRLQNETRYILEEYETVNSNIKFDFINPLESGKNAETVANEFYQSGMMPETINVTENGKVTETIFFPWAVATYDGKSVQIPLLKRKIGDNNEQIVNASVENLEYAFSDAFSKVINGRSKKIAVMRGNGELPDRNLTDFLQGLREYYFIAPFTLDSVAKHPEKTLEELEKFDLVIEAKPTEKFSESEKLVLDQYVMKGGKMLWLVDQVAMEKDSLFTNVDNSALAYIRDLNLNDFFFSYGVRINTALVNDMVSAPIVLAQGSGNQTRYNPFPWFYSPLAVSNQEHQINNNIEAVKFDFATAIDTLKNNIGKKVLLHSSPKSYLEGVPTIVKLDKIKEQPDLEKYNAGKQNLAVLLEGEFTSVYNNRILPFEFENYQNQGKATKMIVVADGDVIKNEFSRQGPIPLGYDRYTATTYGNKEFLMNSVNYLLDDTGLLNIRGKEVKLAFLNTEKVAQNRTSWQLFNLLLPIILLLLFGFIFYTIRRKKYIKN